MTPRSTSGPRELVPCLRKMFDCGIVHHKEGVHVHIHVTLFSVGLRLRFVLARLVDDRDLTRYLHKQDETARDQRAQATPRCTCGLVFTAREDAVAHAKKTLHTVRGLFHAGVPSEEP